MGFQAFSLNSQVLKSLKNPLKIISFRCHPTHHAINANSGQNVSVFCKDQSFANLSMGINSSVHIAEDGCDGLKISNNFYSPLCCLTSSLFKNNVSIIISTL